MELGLFVLSWVLYAVIDSNNVSVTGKNLLHCLVSFRRQFCWKTIPNELQIEISEVSCVNYVICKIA